MITTIGKLLEKRESRIYRNKSHLTQMAGALDYQHYTAIDIEQNTRDIDPEGFVFGRDIWGIGVYGTENSKYAAKYGIS